MPPALHSTTLSERRRKLLEEAKSKQSKLTEEKPICFTNRHSLYLTSNKQIVKYFSKNDAKNFEDEVNTLRSLSHPNIVLYLGTSLREEKLGIVMLYCENGSLDCVIHSPVYVYSMKTVLFWSQQGFSGLEYLSAKKLVHNNIRSENLLLTDRFDLKIGGFGSSKTTNPAKNSQQSETSEITINKDFCSRIDVYSLGLVIWELIERSKPFEGVTNRLNADLEPLNVRNEKLKSFVTKCTSQNAKDRPTPSEAKSQINPLKKDYEKYEFRPKKLPDQLVLLRPLGFDDSDVLVPVPPQKANLQQLTMPTSAEKESDHVHISMDDSFLEKLLEVEITKRLQSLQETKKHAPASSPPESTTIYSSADKPQPFSQLTFGKMVEEVEKLPRKALSININIKQIFKIQINNEELKKQISVFEESLLLLACCAEINLWPALLRTYATCLKKLYYLMENIGWLNVLDVLNVFVNTTTMEEWYYVAEVPLPDPDFKQHIFVNKLSGRGKLMCGIWEDRNLVVFNPKTRIEQESMVFAIQEALTPQWIWTRIVVLRKKQSILVRSILRELHGQSKEEKRQSALSASQDQSTHETQAFSLPGSLCETGSSQEISPLISILEIVPEQSLMDHFECATRSELDSYFKFQNKLALRSLLQDDSIQELCKLWHINLQEIFQINLATEAEQSLNFWTYDHPDQGTLFVLTSPRIRKDCKQKIQCFTNNYRLTEITLSKSEWNRKAKAVKDVSELDSILVNSLNNFKMISNKTIKTC